MLVAFMLILATPYSKEERPQAGSRGRAKTQQGFMRSDLG